MPSRQKNNHFYVVILFVNLDYMYICDTMIILTKIIIMKKQHAIALFLASLISTAANSAEYQFRTNLDGTFFAKIPENGGGTKPVEPEQPQEPEYDITPYQNMKVTGTAGNEREYEFNPSYSLAKSNAIVAMQSNMLLIQVYDNLISAPLSVKDSELEKHIKGIEIITSDNVKHVCKNVMASGIETTNVWCNNFTPALRERMSEPYATETYTLSFTK